MLSSHRPTRVSTAKKEANSKHRSHWGSVCPFHIKDQWVQLKNMSLLENKTNKQAKSYHVVTVLPGYSSYLKGCNKKITKLHQKFFFYFKRKQTTIYTLALPRVTWRKLKGSPLLKTLMAPSNLKSHPHPIRHINMYSHSVLPIYKKLNGKSELSFLSFSFSLEPTPIRILSPLLH